MITRFYSGILIFWAAGYLYSQTPLQLTLKDCYDSARIYYPVFRENRLVQESLDLKMKNLRTSWYPQIVLGAQAVYYSDITELELNLPVPNVQLPKAPHDQYRMFLDVNQTIWDGGFSREQKQYEQKYAESVGRQIETEMQQLRERINNVYFLILLLKENEQWYDLSLQTLKKRMAGIETAVNAGTAMAIQMNQIRAEILRTEQIIAEIKQDREAAISVLGILTGIRLTSQVTLKVPVFAADILTDTLSRPELNLFDAQISANEQMERVLQRKNNPRLFAFAQAGYGNPPGLNLLRNEWDFYWSAGIGMKWNLWDWNSLKRDVRLASMQREKIVLRKETFEKNVRTMLTQEKANISKYQEALHRSEEIIRLHREILNSMASGLENGIITATDYLAEHNTLLQAEIGLSVNKLQLIKAQIAYYTLQGSIDSMLLEWTLPEPARILLDDKG